MKLESAWYNTQETSAKNINSLVLIEPSPAASVVLPLAVRVSGSDVLGLRHALATTDEVLVSQEQTELGVADLSGSSRGSGRGSVATVELLSSEVDAGASLSGWDQRSGNGDESSESKLHVYR